MGRPPGRWPADRRPRGQADDVQAADDEPGKRPGRRRHGRDAHQLLRRREGGDGGLSRAPAAEVPGKLAPSSAFALSNQVLRIDAFSRISRLKNRHGGQGRSLSLGCRTPGTTGFLGTLAELGADDAIAVLGGTTVACPLGGPIRRALVVRCGENCFDPQEGRFSLGSGQFRRDNLPRGPSW